MFEKKRERNNLKKKKEAIVFVFNLFNIFLSVCIRLNIANAKDAACLETWKHVNSDESEKQKEKQKEQEKNNALTKHQNEWYYQWKVTTLFSAKVPIIKLCDPLTNVSCDIGLFDNTRNATNYLEQLLNGSKDTRTTMLLMCVKYWSYQRRINNAYHGFMNSYGYVLLAIKYLQAVQPPLLPVLSSSWMVTRDYDRYNDNTPPSSPPLFATLKRDEHKGNKMYLAELLYGFFEYYSHFDFSRFVVSVADVDIPLKTIVTLGNGAIANGSKQRNIGIQVEGVAPTNEFEHEVATPVEPTHSDVAITSILNPIHFHPLVVQDPFDEENNVAKNVDHVNLRIIQREIVRARNMFTFENFNVLFFSPQEKTKMQVFCSKWVQSPSFKNQSDFCLHSWILINFFCKITKGFRLLLLCAVVFDLFFSSSRKLGGTTERVIQGGLYLVLNGSVALFLCSMNYSVYLFYWFWCYLFFVFFLLFVVFLKMFC
ncbi:hypothetical protein RFI_07017 [Reticulomyxa filosa]|uniref:PAP-associated domain-containing protein n=1 Tax=Reticulomyxa filosa TaxID=46433 RepID=X6NVQ2_RETFI|nr:hypothetical protein RFI_07017 [Reticulomyxa filosa]|eukprot:ETO30101.1 hypothetical protein RFI_07017 [Reticulomyxa filosa]